MSTLVLYDNDADGFGAAFAVWLSIGEKDTSYVSVKRGDPAPYLLEGVDRIIVLDFNYPKMDMTHLARIARDTVLLDHHASAKHELEDLPFCKFDITKSAAVMAWEYFHPDQSVPMFFGYIQDSDLQKWNLPFSREVFLALESYRRDFITWLDLSGIGLPNRDYQNEAMCLESLMSDGEVIARFADRQIEEAVSRSRHVTFILKNEALSNHRLITFDPDAPEDGDGIYRVPVVNTSVLPTDVCNRMLEEHPKALFAATYHDAHHGLRHWNLRSRGDFDVSEICKEFGGGGHHASSGGFKTFHDCDYGVPLEKKHKGVAE